MYNNPYINPYNTQANIDRLNEQINNLEKMKAQMQQPQAPITQNFQLAPTRDVIRYATCLEEIQRDMVIGDTPYFSKDMSVVWIKNTKGDIRTYELTEIIPKDDKDLKIEYLQAQIEELKKGMIKDERKSTIDDTIAEPIEDEKPTSISTISRPKKK